MGEIWKGAPVAAALREGLIPRAAALRERGVTPTLAIVRVGEQDADIAYERGAKKSCEKAGVDIRQFLLPADCTQAALLDVIGQINRDDGIHGCLLFRPLPRQLDERAVCEALNPAKDVDCITGGSLSGVFTGGGAGFPPCTAQACIEILDHYGCAIQGKHAVVVGRSLVIGKPVAMLLLGRNATVTVCHTKTADMAAKCRQADILIAAAGKAGVVGGDFVNPNQVVIDVGINTDGDGNLCGDVRFDQVAPLAAAVTPVPGGVGAVTSTVLAKHVVEAAERRLGVGVC